MRTRTFIGLIVLIIALMVASTPALLEPAAAGVQTAAIKAGVPGVKPIEETAPAEGKDAEESEIEAVLALRGRTVEADGSLRDQYNEASRRNSATMRATSGSSRTLLDGQLPRGAKLPPRPLEDGVLLDRDGCPRFSDDQDVDALWRDEELKARYESKVADSKDPAACRTLLKQRRDEATGEGATVAMPVDARRRSGLNRGSTTDVGFMLAYQDMLAMLMPEATSTAETVVSGGAAS